MTDQPVLPFEDEEQGEMDDVVAAPLPDPSLPQDDGSEPDDAA